MKPKLAITNGTEDKAVGKGKGGVGGAAPPPLPSPPLSSPPLSSALALPKKGNKADSRKAPEGTNPAKALPTVPLVGAKRKREEAAPATTGRGERRGEEGKGEGKVKEMGKEDSKHAAAKVATTESKAMTKITAASTGAGKPGVVWSKGKKEGGRDKGKREEERNADSKPHKKALETGVIVKKPASESKAPSGGEGASKAAALSRTRGKQPAPSVPISFDAVARPKAIATNKPLKADAEAHMRATSTDIATVVNPELSAAATTGITKKSSSVPPSKKAPAGTHREDEDSGSSSEDAVDEREAVATFQRKAANKLPPVHSKPPAAKKMRTETDPDKSAVIYLGHIPHGFVEDGIRGYFSQFGDILRLRLARSRRTGRPKGYAFIEFADADVAKVAAETMHNYPLSGKLLVSHTVPTDKLHPKLWNGATNRSFRKKDRRAIAYKVQNRPKTFEQHVKAVARLVRGEEKEIERLKELGIDYELPASASYSQQAEARGVDGLLVEDAAGSGEEGDEEDLDDDDVGSEDSAGSGDGSDGESGDDAEDDADSLSGIEFDDEGNEVHKAGGKSQSAPASKQATAVTKGQSLGQKETHAAAEKPAAKPQPKAAAGSLAGNKRARESDPIPSQKAPDSKPKRGSASSGGASQTEGKAYSKKA